MRVLHRLDLTFTALPFPPPCAVEKEKTHLEVPLEENVNRRVLEEGSVEARTIEDAIAVLRYVAVSQQRSPLKVLLPFREILADPPPELAPLYALIVSSCLNSKNRTCPLACCSLESI